jgi:RNA polymerase primary sigma factor
MVRENGKEPSPEELSAEMGITTKKLLALLQSSQDLLSLDMAVGDSGGMTLGGLIRDTSNSDPETLMLDQEVIRELQRILNELTEREQRVMRMRFRLEDDDGTMQEEIAKEMKLSRERVRQIEVQAIKKLRALAQRRRLKDILNG